MSKGKLYMSNDEQLLGDVDYQLQAESKTSWWGELIFTNYVRIGDGGGYTLELEDNRRGSCYLKKRVNRAVSGVPPRYIYHFTGTSPLDKAKE